MWQTLHYAAQGRGHLDKMISCQDKTCSLTQNGVTVIALADGAGSAQFSEYGAQTVVETACQYMVNHFERLIKTDNGAQVKLELITVLQDALKIQSQTLHCSLKDLASTMLLVAVKDEQFLLVHVGDGVIGYLKHNTVNLATKPVNGEYANATIFVTSSQAVKYMQLLKGTLADITGFVLLSDGAAESFYYKRNQTLSPILMKLFDPTLFINQAMGHHLLQQSFETTVIKNTRDDCSIALLLNVPAKLLMYSSLTYAEKCQRLELLPTNKRVSKQIAKIDSIYTFVKEPKTASQIARQLRIRKKHISKLLNRLVSKGILIYCPPHFSRSDTN